MKRTESFLKILKARVFRNLESERREDERFLEIGAEVGRSSPTVAIQSSFCGLIIISLNSLVATSMPSLNYMLSLKLGQNLKLPSWKISYYVAT